MTTQFVTYEIALGLKRIGFDEKCLAGFGDIYSTIKPDYINTFEESKYFPILFGEDVKTTSKFGWYGIKCKAPLWQQVIDWFLDNYGILIYQYLNPDKKTFWVVKTTSESFFESKGLAILEAIKILNN